MGNVPKANFGATSHSNILAPLEVLMTDNSAIDVLGSVHLCAASKQATRTQ